MGLSGVICLHKAHYRALDCAESHEYMEVLSLCQDTSAGIDCTRMGNLPEKSCPSGLFRSEERLCSQALRRELPRNSLPIAST